MKITIVNRSDATGGAAVVSFRLMNALRSLGVDARMLVVEKRTDSPCVRRVAPAIILKEKFLAERLKIFLANGMNRRDLFKVDTASDGVSITRHPWVRQADAILLNWINQGMLSLSGIRKLAAEKPVIWTMHDLWCMTGICHHAGSCRHYLKSCGNCPLLGQAAAPGDLSKRVWKQKHELYRDVPLRFVAVSNWLASLARRSSLLRDADISVIPNAFDLSDIPQRKQRTDGKLRILIGAARLDDPIKGIDIFIGAVNDLASRRPDLDGKLEVVTFGNIRNPQILDDIKPPCLSLGRLDTDSQLRAAYAMSDIVVSSSLYETLPGTLVEGQAFGCVPVSFNRGGQNDIIDHLSTGYLAEFGTDTHTSSQNLSYGMEWALSAISGSTPETPEDSPEIIQRMRTAVNERFSAPRVAQAYLSLINASLSAHPL